MLMPCPRAEDGRTAFATACTSSAPLRTLHAGVTPAEFERIAVAALDELPPWARQAMANVALVIEAEDLVEPDIYGIYDGVALPDRDGAEPFEPARIVLYQVPLEADFGNDPVRLVEEIRTTVLHEIGHHFGLDEGQLDDLGYGYRIPPIAGHSGPRGGLRSDPTLRDRSGRNARSAPRPEVRPPVSTRSPT